MTRDFLLPDLGEGLAEAEIVRWLVAAGDAVRLNQPIAEVETAKAIVELPSPYDGIVTALRAATGDVVAVGAPLISFDGGDADADVGRILGEPAAAKAEPNLVGYGAAPRAAGRPQRRARVGGSRSTLPAQPPRPAPPASAPMGVAVSERPRSSPPVRKFAKDRGVDLALVAPAVGSEAVTRADVEAYAIEHAASDPFVRIARPDRDGRTVRHPIRGIRRYTADAMVRSAFTAPHATTFHTVDVTATMALIAELKGDRALAGHRIGLLAVAAKAVCLALRNHPTLNSRWDAEHDEIVEHRYVNLGIAAATDRGLVVPSVKDADAMTLVELADAIGALIEVARAGRASPSDLTGGTFSITNIGVFGVDAGTPILNAGEAGILALGAVRSQPWEYRGEIALRDVMTLSLSFDHRLVDGEQGARFLMEVAGILREPGRAMLLR